MKCFWGQFYPILKGFRAIYIQNWQKFNFWGVKRNKKWSLMLRQIVFFLKVTLYSVTIVINLPQNINMYI